MSSQIDEDFGAGLTVGLIVSFICTFILSSVIWIWYYHAVAISHGAATYNLNREFIWIDRYKVAPEKKSVE